MNKQLTSASESDLRVLCARIMGDTPVHYNYRPLWLNGLELDIFYPSKNLALEYNGAQHYKRSALQSQRQLDKQIERDRIKADICKAKGVRLVIITEKEMQNEEHVETKILNALGEIDGY